MALEAVRREKTISEIATQFEVHSNQIMKWKKQLLENVAGVFSRKQELKVGEMKELMISCTRRSGSRTLNRCSLYYERAGLSEEHQQILEEMDKIYLDFPSYGSRRMGRELRRRGYRAGRLRVRKLMRLLGIEAIYPRKRLSIPAKDHQIYPYLLHEVEIDCPNKVWAADITYIRLKHGFVYLVAVMDVFSHYIISWRLANTLEPGFCCEALKEALESDHPEYFNTDQGAQFTSFEFLSILQGKEIKISMDGKGRVIDNIFIERFWRTLKYEEVYTKCYETVAECRASIGEFIRKYNEERLHQSLAVYDTPFEAYYQLPASMAC